MHLNIKVLCTNAIAILSLIAAQASAQVGGTIWLNYAGGASGTPMGNLNAMDVSIFPGLGGTPVQIAANNAAVQAKILQYVQADYQPFSLNILAGADPGGTRSIVNIGNKPGDLSEDYGVADQIDWRNKNFNNRIGVSLQAHFNFTLDNGNASNGKDTGNVNYTTDRIARVLANTVSHEIGHILGLKHGDPISTYSSTAGNVAAKQAAVQANEFMTLAPKEANFYGSGLSFGEYSTTKLKGAASASDLIKLQNEAGATGTSFPGGADPITRAGNTGATVSTGTLLLPDVNGRVDVLGQVGTGGPTVADYFKFTGVAGMKVRADVFSQLLTFNPPGAPQDNVITDPIDPVLELLRFDSGLNSDVVVGSSIFPAGGNWDGVGGDDVEGDAIMFDFQLPVNGLYAFRVYDSNTGAGQGGSYEMFVQIPEPTIGIALLGLMPFAMRSRFKNRDSTNSLS